MGGKSSTTTQTVQIPPEILARYNEVNKRAEGVSNTPFQQYSTDVGDFVAQINNQQQAGINSVNEAAGSFQPFFQGAAGATMAGLGDLNVEKYMNPYQQDVINATMRQMSQANDLAQSGALGTAISSGAFGGDRAGIAAANLANQQGMAMGSTLAGLNAQNYDQALAAAQQEATRYLQGGQQLAGLGSAFQQAGLQGAEAQLNSGTLQQQTEQAGLEALYNQFQQEKAYPFQVAQFLANIAMGTGALSGSTTTTVQPGSFWSDRRLKHDIKRIGKTDDGLPIYKFKYKGDPEEQTHIGFMADEVEQKKPEAVGVAENGYKYVDYDRAARATGGGVAGPYGSQVGSQPGAGGYVPQAYLPVGELMIADPGTLQEARRDLMKQLEGVAKLGESVKSLDTTYQYAKDRWQDFGNARGGVVNGYALGGMPELPDLEEGKPDPVSQNTATGVSPSYLQGNKDANPVKSDTYLSDTLAQQEGKKNELNAPNSMPGQPESTVSKIGNTAEAATAVLSLLAMSDRRAKHDIKRIGRTDNGTPIYSFKYKGDDRMQTHIGFMADEVEKHHPDAVATGPDGYKRVDYSQAEKFYQGGVVGRHGYATDGEVEDIRTRGEKIADYFAPARFAFTDRLPHTLGAVGSLGYAGVEGLGGLAAGALGFPNAADYLFGAAKNSMARSVAHDLEANRPTPRLIRVDPNSFRDEPSAALEAALEARRAELSKTMDLVPPTHEGFIPTDYGLLQSGYIPMPPYYWPEGTVNADDAPITYNPTNPEGTVNADDAPITYNPHKPVPPTGLGARLLANEPDETFSRMSPDDRPIVRRNTAPPTNPEGPSPGVVPTIPESPSPGVATVPAESSSSGVVPTNPENTGPDAAAVDPQALNPGMYYVHNSDPEDPWVGRVFFSPEIFQGSRLERLGNSLPVDFIHPDLVPDDAQWLDTGLQYYIPNPDPNKPPFRVVSLVTGSPEFGNLVPYPTDPGEMPQSPRPGVVPTNPEIPRPGVATGPAGSPRPGVVPTSPENTGPGVVPTNPENTGPDAAAVDPQSLNPGTYYVRSSDPEDPWVYKVYFSEAAMRRLEDSYPFEVRSYHEKNVPDDAQFLDPGLQYYIPNPDPNKPPFRVVSLDTKSPEFFNLVPDSTDRGEMPQSPSPGVVPNNPEGQSSGFETVSEEYPSSGVVPTNLNSLRPIARPAPPQIPSPGVATAIPESSSSGVVPAIPESPSPGVATVPAESPRPGVVPAGQAGLDMAAAEDAFNNFVLQRESGNQQFESNGRPVESGKGAIGAAQVMEDTGPEAAALAGLPWDRDRWLNDKDYNTALGRAYFLEQYRRFGSIDKALAAYNAGPTALSDAMDQAIRHGGSYKDYLPGETQRYISAFNAGGDRAVVTNSGVAPRGRTNEPFFGLGDRNKPFEDRTTVGKMFYNPDGSVNRNAMLSLMSGVGSMLASPSQWFLPSLGLGLQGFAGTYSDLEKRAADIEQTRALTLETQVRTDAGRFIEFKNGSMMVIIGPGRAVRMTDYLANPQLFSTGDPVQDARILAAARAAQANPSLAGAPVGSDAAQPYGVRWTEQSENTLERANASTRTELGFMSRAANIEQASKMTQDAVAAGSTAAQGKPNANELANVVGAAIGDGTMGSVQGRDVVLKKLLSPLNAILRSLDIELDTLDDPQTRSQLLTKMSQLNAQTLMPDQLRAVSAFNGFVALHPNLEMTPEAASMITASLMLSNQQDIDRARYYQNFRNTAETGFDPSFLVVGYNEEYGGLYQTEKSNLENLFQMASDSTVVGDNGKTRGQMVQDFLTAANAGMLSQEQAQKVLNFILGAEDTSQLLARYFVLGE